MLNSPFVQGEALIKLSGIGDIIFLIILGGFALLIMLALYKKLVSKKRSKYEVTPSQKEESLNEAVIEKQEELDEETISIEGGEESGDKEASHEERPEVIPIKVEELAKPIQPKTLKEGLKKTHDGFISRLNRIFFSSKSITKQNIDAIEEVLFTSDVGVKTSQRLLDFLSDTLSKKELEDSSKVREALKQKIKEMIKIDAPPIIFDKKPYIIMVVGVNGVGKTTTIGKLGSKYKALGKTVLFAAGDTFRAAASEQIEIWGERTGIQVVSGQEGGDPAAVIYDAISAAKAKNIDIVIADTAGRLHTKLPLMEELKKVKRVCNKAVEGAPHEIFLVLDANTGQNAISQAREFNEALNITGIILTKLDGTAKGGVVIGICDELKKPIRYIGIGESVEDLRDFDPDEFVEALFEQ
ncbi:MAG: signal recognition particle-docking protein FtsY [Deltaproteobacteria bacterium]|nr:signal recognition particle-docking protein FtsY [Deltaproteobacteria bacterium]